MRPLLLATTNQGKLREIRQILYGLALDVRSLADVPAVTEPEETGTTFDENARQKALHYAAATGLSVVAEDSGLEIDDLDGAPGIYSARFGADEAPSYPEKFELIYRRLRERRGRVESPARFVCALAFVAKGSVVFQERGTVEGHIVEPPRGSGGFGYDPIFFYPPFAVTLAELDPTRKASVSHRGAAFRKLREYLAQRG
ncbi:MAG: RdgB/HAM1 family non-canonical purine NTP pyrophosphatase [Acidobacteria bacterium]|nr:MAG: RdgB/HAM1 family non-canonical purine NTP pyrophosphatase [Acidobacteriota bacterium]